MASAGRAVTGPDLAEDAGGSPSADAAAIAAIDRALRAVRRRVRLQRALSGASVLGVAGLGVFALALAAAKAGDPAPFLPGTALAVALPLLGASISALQRCPPLLCARLLDRALRQPDLLASAFAFAQLSGAERSPFMRACILQAGAAARTADPRRALPLRAPRALRPAAALALGVALLAALEVEAPQPVVAAARPRPRLLHQDDVQAFRQEVAPLLQAPETDPLVRRRAEELNALLEALHGGELERAQALAELRAIEKKLELEGREGEDEALREALQALGRTLAGDALAKPVADAFQSGSAETARAELERLADRVAEERKRDALRKLADSLARAGRTPEERDAAAQRAQQELDRLLQQKNDPKQDPAARERLLRDKRRELDKLQRERQQREQAQRSLDDLRRDLSSASQQLQGQRGGEARDRLRSAADQLKDAAQRQRSAQQRGQLAERLAQLRELLSKQGAGAGAGRQGQGQNGKKGQNGQQGAGQRLDMDRFARIARGQQGKPGGGEQGEEGKQPDGMVVMPGQGQNGSDGEMPGENATSSMRSQGAVLAPSQGEPGEGGRPQLGDATRSDGTRVDTRVQGEAGDKGPTRSQVIREAGQRGFVTRGYERVHADYERHAEAVLEHDRVPGGYRFYVRRYFQLIRPREGEP